MRHPPRYRDVCLTGGLGFIGTHLCRALADRGVRVRCVDRASGPHSNGVSRWAPLTSPEPPNVRIIHVDVGSDSLDSALDGAEAVIHLAALPGVRAGHLPAALWRENTLTTSRLARETARRGQRLVLASTSSVYGNAPLTPTAEHTRPFVR